MRLYSYEMKKLLFNKSRLILLAVLFALYTLFSFALSLGSEASADAKKTVQPEYNRLVAENTGVLNPELYAESVEAYMSAIEKYGKREELNIQVQSNALLKFYAAYAAFGQKVEFYWNGSDEQDVGNISGVYPIQEKLKELESNGKTNSYEYKFYQHQLDKELAIGEPVFENVTLWNGFSVCFENMFVLLLMMMVLTFFISSSFTQEVKTEMDSIVLCTLKGRREIVTAKLLASATASAILAATYLTGVFIGSCFGYGDFSGTEAPARCLELFGQTTLNMSVGGVMLFSAAWLIFAAVVFGIALSFISSAVKNQSAAFGLGIVVLVVGTFSSSMKGAILRLLWPIADFNFGRLATIGEIFGRVKTYNIFGTPVSYGIVAPIVCLILFALACLLTYIAQRKRSAV